MNQDKFALVEKILKDVDIIMTKNAELCTFDIVPVDTNFRNKSPVLHLENCLGLESWCVKHVYTYCYTELMDKYLSKPKRKSLILSSLNSDRLVKLLNVALLLNPELTTLWNKRREMVERSILDKKFEMRFTTLVLSRKPKCNDAFGYRRWLLQRILQVEDIQVADINDLVNYELYICELASDKSPNNYHSWNHRMWLVKMLKNYEKQFDLKALYIKEYDFSERWTAKHVSDFSCFHYRQFCIRNIFTINTESSWKMLEDTVNIDLHKSFIRTLAVNLPKDIAVNATEDNLVCYTKENLMNLLLGDSLQSCICRQDPSHVCRKLEILFHELALNNELVKFYKHHETLWHHRRFVAHEILAMMYDYFGLTRQSGQLVKLLCRICQPDELRQKQAKMVKYDSSSIYSTVLFSVLLTHELGFVEKRRLDGDNYAERHEKYLKYVEGLNAMV